MVKDGGITTSVNVATGEILKQGRAADSLGEYYASPVAANGKITFDFREVTLSDVPQSVTDRYTAPFVNQCFSNNRSTSMIAGPAQPPNCP